MDKTLNKNRVGIAVGSVYALWHFIWSLLVLFGWANSFLSFVLGMHFLSNPFMMNEFSFFTAIMLIIVTYIIGFLLGWVFAYCWNLLHREQGEVIVNK